MGYSHEYSNFPDSIYSPPSFSDLDSTTSTDIMSVVAQIKALQIKGEYAAADSVLKANYTTLKPYMFCAENINAISEEIKNLEIGCFDFNVPVYYSASEPEAAVTSGTVWIGSGDLS